MCTLPCRGSVWISALRKLGERIWIFFSLVSVQLMGLQCGRKKSKKKESGVAVQCGFWVLLVVLN